MWFQLIIFIIFILVCLTLFQYKEHFWFIPQGMILPVNDGTGEICSGLSRYDCKRNSACGMCYPPTVNPVCVAGDWNGPLNGSDCVAYEYGTDYANLSLIDPQQPYFVEPNRYWDWTKHLHSKIDNIPRPLQEGGKYFHHGNPPQQHHRKLIQKFEYLMDN